MKLYNHVLEEGLAKIEYMAIFVCILSTVESVTKKYRGVKFVEALLHICRYCIGSFFLEPSFLIAGKVIFAINDAFAAS